MRKTAEQKKIELRQLGYLSYDESDKTCPASHELHTAHLFNEDGTIRWCEKCKRYSLIKKAQPVINLSLWHNILATVHQDAAGSVKSVTPAAFLTPSKIYTHENSFDLNP